MSQARDVTHADSKRGSARQRFRSQLNPSGSFVGTTVQRAAGMSSNPAPVHRALPGDHQRVSPAASGIPWRGPAIRRTAWARSRGRATTVIVEESHRERRRTRGSRRRPRPSRAERPVRPRARGNGRRGRRACAGGPRRVPLDRRRAREPRSDRRRRRRPAGAASRSAGRERAEHAGRRGDQP